MRIEDDGKKRMNAVNTLSETCHAAYVKVADTLLLADPEPRFKRAAIVEGLGYAKLLQEGRRRNASDPCFKRCFRDSCPNRSVMRLAHVALKLGAQTPTSALSHRARIRARQRRLSTVQTSSTWAMARATSTPRDELKKRSETYAQYIYGDLLAKLQEHESMPEEEKIKAKFTASRCGRCGRRARSTSTTSSSGTLR